MNGMPKYVVSKTLHDPAWSNTTVLAGDVATEVAALKGGDGGLRVFPETDDKVAFSLTSAQAFASGVVARTYAPA
jgi:hypothetical protein